MTRRSIEVPGIHHGGAPIPQASLVGPLLTSSGINGMDAGTGEVPAALKKQVRLIFVNIAAVVAEAGGSVEDIARCVFYVRERSARAVIDAEWTAMFPDPASRPARHTITYALTDPLLVQAELTAFIQEEAR